MSNHRLEDCRQDLSGSSTGDARWTRACIRSAKDMETLIRTISAALDEAGFSEHDKFKIHLALEEAIVNANKHGHGGDWNKLLAVRFHIGAKGLVFQVEDQGPGFDRAKVPDPLDDENLESNHGRGLLLMRSLMSEICHNDKGNCVCVCKHAVGIGHTE